MNFPVLLRRVSAIALCFAAFLRLLTLPASAQVYEKVFDFGGSVNLVNKGCSPRAALVQASDGNFYGTTAYGGASDRGTVFRMTPAGILTTLVDFTDHVGQNPTAAVVQGSDGNLYGTTSSGGETNNGTVFRMTPTGALTTLVQFTGASGSNKGGSPYAGLVQGSDGSFYGTTSSGGANGLGTVFKMTPGGVLTTLVEFSGGNGRNPAAVLVQGINGNFYGTTRGGGANDLGTVFKMTPFGALTTLVEFTGNGAGNKGADPRAGLVQGSDGSFYGTTTYGGANANYGTVFKLDPNAPPNTGLTTLIEFDPGITNNAGGFIAGLVQGSDGNFSGTSLGGGSGYGTVFKMTPAGSLTTLVEFTGREGSNKGGDPAAGLVQGRDGFFTARPIISTTGQRCSAAAPYSR